MSPTWYDVLGVERDATPDEVRAAWRRSIADLDPSDRRFRSANEAAEVLLDADRRRAYDATLPAEEPEPAPEPVVVPAPVAPRSDDRPVTDEKTSATGEKSPAGRSGRRLPVLLLAVAGVVTLALVVLAAVVWFRPHVDPDDVGAAQSAAEQAIVPVLSYDYRELDEDAEAARSYLTEDYQEEYTQLFTVISDNAPRTEAVVRAEVIASSVVRTSPDAVEVLLFVNRPTTNKQVTEPVVYRDQVTVTMVRDDDGWLVDRLQTTPAPE
ncbi:J domain-containing protein [Nocardioides sp. AX2bis]|uniref:J domain-containing protein n=1 Tax=Nocardioides sp. AX2bis TaxID=2653157 RepID=UPI0012F06F02|nr:J domain-containing protein [Nocardioides sp. AX2bis]VXC17457.1 Mce-associated membrane protein [Nocardioides sp. AX2bis]